jgi:hypothetical protein
MISTYSVEDQINDISFQRPHVVILGAGASYAATPNGDRNGFRLPLMENLIDVVGLRETFSKYEIEHLANSNFEVAYTEIHADPKHQEACEKIEAIIDSYFSKLSLPEEPTIYDFLVLSLRPKDVIATFNWDPFLFQAARRNYEISRPPRLIFLHGNAGIGYCETHRIKAWRSSVCPHCDRLLSASRLLYPIAQKNYTQDPLIKAEWTGLQSVLGRAFGITLFGYGAPQSDVEAVRLMKEAWGDTQDRKFEQTEIIDIKPEDELLETWNPFIHSLHYDAHNSFFDSWMFNHPRRSCEAWWAQNLEVKFVEENPIPRECDFASLYDWLTPLLDVERTKEQSGGATV